MVGIVSSLGRLVVEVVFKAVSSESRIRMPVLAADLAYSLSPGMVSGGSGGGGG